MTLDPAAEEAMAILERQARVQPGVKLALCEERNTRQAETIREQREEILRLQNALGLAEGRIFSLNEQAIRHRAERKGS